MSDELVEVAALAQRVAELETQNEALRLEADQLDLQVAELEDEVEALEAQLAAAEARDFPSNRSGSGLGSDEERVYLGSKKRRHFHRPGCTWTEWIPEYLLIEFGSHAEAVEAGYKPCKTCRA